MLKPLNTGVFFVFADETTHSAFANRTASGIIIKGGPQADVPRWGAVVRVGEDVTEVATGDCVLIEPGMWTTAFETDGLRMWKTDESKIICISDEPEAVL